MKLKLAITPGDVNGIGYEVILKTLAEPHILESCTPIIYGSLKIANIHRKTLEGINLNFNQINNPKDAQAHKVNMINCTDDTIQVQFGKATKEAGMAAFQSLERACADLKSGLVNGLVTAPINKDTIQSDKFHFHGHTEYLEDKFSEGNMSLMMLLNESMRVALVTNHTPISEVASQINEDIILRKLTVFNESLKNDFGIRKPRIAVLALNPHAGDNGLLGKEEQEIIIPAIKKANDADIWAIGPYSADGFFGAATYKNFDGILAMYHDQGLIPFKALDMNGGVNYTAGLNIVRTSPDHGTGYDIAGKDQACEQSFRTALFAAIDIYIERERNKEYAVDPLHTKEKRINNRE